MKSYVFGIDVGGTTVKCGLFATDGNLLDKWEIPTRKEQSGELIVPDIAHTVQQKMDERGITAAEVAGLGIGVPGPVDEKGEVVIGVNLGWGRKDVSSELEAMLGIPVKAGNDANVAALGEMWMGSGKGYKSLIMVTLGTGVGGGIIINEKIVVGAHGAAGEIGHASMDTSLEDTCNCGNQHGCLEQFASATGIVRLAKQELAKLEKATDVQTEGDATLQGKEPAVSEMIDSEIKEPTVLKLDTVTSKAVFDAYKEGDAVAARIVERFAEYLGRALATFAGVVDPQVFVIGGGVSKAGQPLLDLVQESYNNHAFPACKGTPMVQAQLGNDAGIYGSAKLALDECK